VDILESFVVVVGATKAIIQIDIATYRMLFEPRPSAPIYAAEQGPVKKFHPLCVFAGGAAGAYCSGHTQGAAHPVAGVRAVRPGNETAARLTLFGRFAAIYPVFFVELDSGFTFLSQINGYVHEEVQKLHPDAQLPRFDCASHGSGRDS